MFDLFINPIVYQSKTVIMFRVTQLNNVYYLVVGKVCHDGQGTHFTSSGFKVISVIKPYI